MSVGDDDTCCSMISILIENTSQFMFPNGILFSLSVIKTVEKPLLDKR